MDDDLLTKFNIKGVHTVNQMVENPSGTNHYEGRKNSKLRLDDSAGQSYELPSVGDFELDREQVQDMIASSEARTDTKFARLEGKLDLILEQFKHATETGATEREYVREELSTIRADNRSTRQTVIGGSVGLAGLILTLVAIGVAVWGVFESKDAALHQAPPAYIQVVPQNQIQPEPTPKALPQPIRNNI
jgi:hypothetical protein